MGKKRSGTGIEIIGKRSMRDEIEVTGKEWSWEEDGRVMGEHGSMTIEQSGKGWKLEEGERVVGKDGTGTRVEGSGKG